MEISRVVSQLRRNTPAELSEIKRSSAVGLILIEINKGLQIVLVKRTADSRSYSGDWCLPGGRVESSDKSLSDTAIREICEEIGLEARQLKLIGQLDDFYTAQADRVRPFVFYVPHLEGSITLSASELVTYQLVGLERILDIGIDHLNLKGSTRKPPYSLQLPATTAVAAGENQVWGLTANILASFRNICYGLCDPIDRTLSLKPALPPNLVN